MVPLDHDAASRLALAHSSDLDLWAGLVADSLGLPASWARQTARTLAVEGDSVAARLALILPRVPTTDTPI